MFKFSLTTESLEQLERAENAMNLAEARKAQSRAMKLTESNKVPHATDVARHIKAHLEYAFPCVKFSLRTTGETGPIDIHWTDGPDEYSVEDIADEALAALDPFKVLKRPLHHCSLYRSAAA